MLRSVLQSYKVAGFKIPLLQRHGWQSREKAVCLVVLDMSTSLQILINYCLVAVLSTRISQIKNKIAIILVGSYNFICMHVLHISKQEFCACTSNFYRILPCTLCLGQETSLGLNRRQCLEYHCKCNGQSKLTAAPTKLQFKRQGKTQGTSNKGNSS